MASRPLRAMVLGSAALVLVGALGCTPPPPPDQGGTSSSSSPQGNADKPATSPGAGVGGTMGEQQAQGGSAADQAAELDQLRKENAKLTADMQTLTCSSATGAPSAEAGKAVLTCFNAAALVLDAAQRLPPPSVNASPDDSQMWSRLQQAAEGLRGVKAAEGNQTQTAAHVSSGGSRDGRTQGALLSMVGTSAIWALASAILSVASSCLLISLFFKTQRVKRVNERLAGEFANFGTLEVKAKAAREKYDVLLDERDMSIGISRINEWAEGSMEHDPDPERLSAPSAEAKRAAMAQPLSSTVRADRSYASPSSFTADSSPVPDYQAVVDAPPAKYAPIFIPESAPAQGQPSDDPLDNYKRARSMASADGQDWFIARHPAIRLTCRNLSELQFNPAAKLYFERSGYGDFLALDQGGSMLVFPSFKLELASSRNFLEGVFRYPEGAATLQVARPAVVQSTGEEWVLQQPGEIAGG